MEQHIQSSLTLCFKRKRLKPYTMKTLSRSLLLVALGIRATHLIDRHITAELASQLGDRLRKDKGCRNIIILQFSNQYTFVGHRQRLWEHYQQCYDKGYYVDVQGTEPAKLDKAPEDVHQFLTQQLGPYLEQLNASEGTSPVSSSSTTPVSTRLDFILPELPCFMVALTGWLLEYPVIYVCHQVGETRNEWESRTNCLGNTPLALTRWEVGFRDTSSLHLLLSFTYPLDVLQDSKQRQDILEDMERKFASRLRMIPSLDLTLSVHQQTTVMSRVAL